MKISFRKCSFNDDVNFCIDTALEIIWICSAKGIFDEIKVSFGKLNAK